MDVTVEERHIEFMKVGQVHGGAGLASQVHGQPDQLAAPGVLLERGGKGEQLEGHGRKGRARTLSQTASEGLGVRLVSTNPRSAKRGRPEPGGGGAATRSRSVKVI